MATRAGQCSNGNVVLRILSRARARGLSTFGGCLSMFQPGLSMISQVECKISRQSIGYWGYRHETGYSQAKTTRVSLAAARVHSLAQFIASLSNWMGRPKLSQVQCLQIRNEQKHRRKPGI